MIGKAFFFALCKSAVERRDGAGVTRFAPNVICAIGGEDDTGWKNVTTGYT
jgi:hypothetical protein